jgi:hypothetical protein
MSGCAEGGCSSGKPKRRGLVGWPLLLGSLAALVIFAATFGHSRQAKELRHLLFANTALPAAPLSACLMQRLPLEGQWLSAPDKPGRVGAWNARRDLMVEVMDAGAKGRRVEMSSIGGRSLTAPEAEGLRLCLSGK